MLKKYLQKLIERKNLTADECELAVQSILNNADTHQIAAFLVLLHSKGETAGELLSFVKIMRAKMKTIQLTEKVLDIVGTGGDGAQTLNISTGASIIVASCGVKVAKHGNRSVSSQCGSADLLEALGIKIDLNSEQVAQSIANNNIGFCFAPNFHPAMQQVKPVRAALGVRTTFNLLGPLLNPARANYLLLGVSHERYLHLFADVLAQLNVDHALVVHGNGLDELSLLGPSKVIEIRNGEKQEGVVDPKAYEFQYGTLNAIQGRDAQFNAHALLEVFKGQKGPVADTLILNAGVGLYIANFVKTIHAGIQLARENLTNGQALTTLEKWVNFGK